jgi:YggT family protein
VIDTFCATCFVVVFVRTFIWGVGWALSIAIFARVILSWISLPLPVGLQRWLFDVTEPVLGPIRRALPTSFGLDFSPLIALILVGLIRDLLLMLVPVSIAF